MENLKLTYCLVGSSITGKTKISSKYLNKEFIDLPHPTPNFGKKTIRINNKEILINIHDTPGQERLMSLNLVRVPDSNAVFFIYNITNRESFDFICHNILPKVKEKMKEHTILVLVGNFVDLKKQREVSYDEAKEFADNNNMLYFETSGETGENIDNMFNKVTEKIIMV